jgi:hypothetical protein
MTKEDIMQQEYASRVMNWEKAYKQQPSIFESAHAAMDQYAKQQAAAFGIWLIEHNLNFQPSTEGKLIGANLETYTPEELYDIFEKTHP